jgi:hypothetical protein
MASHQRTYDCVWEYKFPMQQLILMYYLKPTLIKLIRIYSNTRHAKHLTKQMNIESWFYPWSVILRFYSIRDPWYWDFILYPWSMIQRFYSTRDPWHWQLIGVVSVYNCTVCLAPSVGGTAKRARDWGKIKIIGNHYDNYMVFCFDSKLIKHRGQKGLCKLIATSTNRTFSFYQSNLLLYLIIRYQSSEWTAPI